MFEAGQRKIVPMRSALLMYPSPVEEGKSAKKKIEDIVQVRKSWCGHIQSLKVLRENLALRRRRIYSIAQTDLHLHVIVAYHDMRVRSEKLQM